MDHLPLGVQVSIALVGIALILSGMVFVGAVITRTSCRIVVGFAPPYVMAIKALSIGLLASLPISLVSTIILKSIETSTGAVLMLGLTFFAGLTVASFLLNAWVFGATIKHPERGPIGTKKAVVVSIVGSLFGLVLALTIGAAATIMTTSFSNHVRKNENSPVSAEENVFDQFDETTANPRKELMSDEDVFGKFDPASAKPWQEFSQQPNEPAAEPPFSTTDKQQLDEAAAEVMEQYPILRWGSATANNEAIKQTAAFRDYYIEKERMSPAAALRRAAREIATQYASIATNPTPSIQLQTPRETRREVRPQKPQCSIKPVMTDEEIALCK